MTPHIQIVQQLQAPPEAPAAHEHGGTWLCAMAADGRLLGALHALPEQGRSRARCSFHLGRVVHSAPELGLHQVQTTLQLGHDATGEAELSGLYLAPPVAAALPASTGTPAPTPEVVADALLQAALAHLAQRPDSNTAASWLIVELPGWRDAAGRSPFWDGLVRHFLPPDSLNPADAVQRHGPAFSTHLGEMLPRQLIHAAFLPLAAQQALGRCADSHLPWQAALQRAGFADWRHGRIDDGGPLMALALHGSAGIPR